MTPDDLDPDVKRQLLDHVRSKLGDAEYRRMVGALGENGVIETVLQQMKRTTPAVDLPEVPEWAVDAAGWVVFMMVLVGLPAVGNPTDPNSTPVWGKLLIGVVGSAADVVLLVALGSAAQRADSKLRFEPDGCLQALWGVFIILWFVAGAVLGPVLLVSGVIDRFR